MLPRNTSCSLAKLVKAEPFDGCTGFTNAAAIPNSIVVVQRGGCTFVDKAMNIQVWCCHGDSIADLFDVCWSMC